MPHPASHQDILWNSLRFLAQSHHKQWYALHQAVYEVRAVVRRLQEMASIDEQLHQGHLEREEIVELLLERAALSHALQSKSPLTIEASLLHRTTPFFMPLDEVTLAPAGGVEEKWTLHCKRGGVLLDLPMKKNCKGDFTLFFQIQVEAFSLQQDRAILFDTSVSLPESKGEASRIQVSLTQEGLLCYQHQSHTVKGLQKCEEIFFEHANLLDGQFHSIVLQRDCTARKLILFIDGVEVECKSFSFIPYENFQDENLRCTSLGGPLRSEDRNKQRFFEGALASFGFYTGLLSLKEIVLLYHFPALLDLHDPHWRIFYDFDQRSTAGYCSLAQEESFGELWGEGEARRQLVPYGQGMQAYGLNITFEEFLRALIMLVGERERQTVHRYANTLRLQFVQQLPPTEQRDEIIEFLVNQSITQNYGLLQEKGRFFTPLVKEFLKSSQAPELAEGTKEDF